MPALETLMGGMPIARGLPIGITEVRQLPNLIPRLQGLSHAASSISSAPGHWHDASTSREVLTHTLAPQCQAFHQYPVLPGLVQKLSTKWSTEFLPMANVPDESFEPSKTSPSSAQPCPHEPMVSRAGAIPPSERLSEELQQLSDSPSGIARTTRCDSSSNIDETCAEAHQRYQDSACQTSSNLPLVSDCEGTEHGTSALPAHQVLGNGPHQSDYFRPWALPRDLQLHYLEKRLNTLLAEKSVLRLSTSVVFEREQKMRNLNMRLAQEVQEVRKQKNSLEAQMQNLTQELEALRCAMNVAPKTLTPRKRSSRNRPSANKLEGCPEEQVVDSSIPDVTCSHVCGLEMSASADDMQPNPPSSPSMIPSNLSEPWSEVHADCSFDMCSRDGGLSHDIMCACNNVNTWGCQQHNFYQRELLLAHRDIRIRTLQGPPGLEASESMPSPELAELRLVALQSLPRCNGHHRH